MSVRGRSLEFERLEDEFGSVVSDLELYTYYQLLEVEPDSSPDRALYNYNLRKYEYEKLQKDHRCSAALYQSLTLLLDRLDEAREVLCDEQLRRHYDARLELGQTRHAEVVERRRKTRPKAVLTAEQELAEKAAARLQRTIHKEYLDAPEEQGIDVSEGIEADLLDRESKTLEGELAGYGVAVDVVELPPEEAVPIEAEYLEKAERDLRLKLYRDGASLHAPAEAEDVAADAAFVAGMTEQLHAELAEMGVPEKEEVEEDALPPDAELLDKLLGQEQRAVQDLGVATAVWDDSFLMEQTASAADAAEAAQALEADLSRLKVEYAAERGPEITIDPLEDLPFIAERPQDASRANHERPVLIPVATPAAPVLSRQTGPHRAIPEPEELVIDLEAAPLPPATRPAAAPPPSEEIAPIIVLDEDDEPAKK